MANRLCERLGCEFPLMAFSHCRDVVAAVSRAGGFGVFGASSHTPQQLELELQWIDEHVDARPYGVDILMPENMAVTDDVDAAALANAVPDAHLAFTRKLLQDHGVGDGSFDRPDSKAAESMLSILPGTAEELLDVAFRHPIKLIANALGVPPAAMRDRAKAHGVPIAALVGAREHAKRQAEVGVDLIVAQGGEAGGHCGEVSTLVLVPEIIAALADHPEVMIAAAGGIMNGRQMAACLALGADAVWTGSVWLATTEAEVSPIFQEKMIAATSRQTVRSRGRTGKPARQLVSAWTDAWAGPDSPGALPMPLQQLLSLPAFEQIDKAAARGDEGAKALVTYFVGQGVGLIDSVRSSRQVVEEFMTGCVEAMDDLRGLIDDAG